MTTFQAVANEGLMLLTVLLMREWPVFTLQNCLERLDKTGLYGPGVRIFLKRLVELGVLVLHVTPDDPPYYTWRPVSEYHTEL